MCLRVRLSPDLQIPPHKSTLVFFPMIHGASSRNNQINDAFDASSSCVRMIVLWFQNMASECTQYSTIHCIFLREEFACLLSVLAKLFLRFEESNILSGSFDKVDEIDMLS